MPFIADGVALNSLAGVGGGNSHVMDALFGFKYHMINLCNCTAETSVIGRCHVSDA
jgi:hypothetical protein